VASSDKGGLKAFGRSLFTSKSSASASILASDTPETTKPIIVKAGTINSYSKREAAGETDLTSPETDDSSDNPAGKEQETEVSYVPSGIELAKNNINNNNNNSEESASEASTKHAQRRAFFASLRESAIMSPNASDEPAETEPLRQSARDDSDTMDILNESDLLNPGTPTQAPNTPTMGEPLRAACRERGQSSPQREKVPDKSSLKSSSKTNGWSKLENRSSEDAGNGHTKHKHTSLGKKIIRWVHHPHHSDSPGDHASSHHRHQPSSPSSPTTPHIVVSGHEDSDEGEEEGEGEGEETPPVRQPQEDTQSIASRRSAKMLHKGQSLDSQAERHNSITSYLIAETARAKSRRNSMYDMMQRASSVSNLSLTPSQQQHLARVASASNLRRGHSKASLAPSGGVDNWVEAGKDSMLTVLSALYGKILVVMGLAFPIGEFISGEMPLSLFKGYYLFLHLGSIIFLMFAYGVVLRTVPLPSVDVRGRLNQLRGSTIDLGRRLSQGMNLFQGDDPDKGTKARLDPGSGQDGPPLNITAFPPASKNYTITESTHESMYLKMGAMVFGIGSMIYSGLEVGQYFDLKTSPECADILYVISPTSRMVFTFIQMYFIFMNSRVAITRHRTIARFGLMHMIATNLCIWLNVLVEETKHEIHSLTHDMHDTHHGGGGDDPKLYGKGIGDIINQIHEGGHNASEAGHHLSRRAADQSGSYYDCRKSDMMSRLVDNASPFLFPCTIEYSLLCSGVLYVMWKNITVSKHSETSGNCGDSDISTFIARKARHHYSVDCAHATRGLFMGILVLVLTIISLILFFVLINNEEMKEIAILEANIIELSVYSVAIVTILIGMWQMRELEFIEHGEIELDNILLVIAQVGTFIYTSFTIIGCNFVNDSSQFLPFFTAVITLLQTTLQTLFIFMASRRCCYTYEQLSRKPGRQMVTFLLICNLSMWAISTFETSRADAHPTLLNYYGVWAWTIISHVSMPLAIFYRFHSTVCLCEIWKRSYKFKHDFLDTEADVEGGHGRSGSAYI